MRTRKCLWPNIGLVVLCFAAPATTWPLGLDEIKAESALNERFDGRIDVSDARNYGKSEIVVSMASRQDFERVMTKWQDTLWKIANRTLASDRVTVHQQMLAFQRKNPRAFMRDNINLLKAGYVLEIPTEPEALATPHAMALADVAEQSAAWRENRLPRRSSPAQHEEVVPATLQPEVGVASQVDATREQRENSADADDPIGRVRILANTVDKGIGTATGTGANVSQLMEEKETLSRKVDELGYQIGREKEIAANQVAAKDRQLDIKTQEIAQLKKQLRQQRETLEQLQANQNQNQNPNTEASEIPWWMSPMLMLGAVGVLILILAIALINARRSRAALSAAEASSSAVPIEPEPALQVVPEAMLSINSIDGMDEQEAENLSDGDEVDTGMVDPTIADHEDSDLDILGTEEETSIEETAAGQSAEASEAADIISEAEIHITYGRVGQAVSLLSGVLEKEPKRHDVRLKLLEVFVESNDEAGFEAHAHYLAENFNDFDILQAYHQLEEQLREGVIDPSGEADTDINAKKIDLAEAYIDMGDDDGAKEILNEVVEEGTPEQRAKAQEMLGGIA